MAIGRLSSPARILCVDQYSHLGGGQKSLIDLLPAFSARGWNPIVATPGGGPLEQLLKTRGYRTHPLLCGDYSIKKKSMAESLRYATEQPQLAKSVEGLVAQHDSTLIYVNGPRLLPAAAFVARRRGIPLVFHCHNRLLQPSAIVLAGTALHWADAHVIACCHYAVEPLKQYVRQGRLNVIFNGVEEMAAVRRPRRSRIRRIGVVGRVEAEKGQLQFVEAAPTILQKVPDCSFVIAGAPMFSGDAYQRRVIESSCDLPLTFLGWRENIAEVYGDLELLVVPSSALEATTRVILEAFSAGVPVVAFPSGGIPEILRDNETGFLTENATAESLARRVLSVIDLDANRVEAVVRQARMTWSARYTVTMYRDNVCNMLSRIAGFVQHQPEILVRVGAAAG